MKLSLVTAVLLLASHGASAAHLNQRQGFVSSLLSIFGPPGDDDSTSESKTTSAKPSRTPSPSATTTKKAQSTITSTVQSVNPSPTPTSTDSDTDTTSSTATDTSTITSSATLTSTPSSTPSPVNPQPSPQPANSSGGISPAGIAVAVIFTIVILLVIAWLVFRYHPKCRAWWLARQEEKYKKRSHREGFGSNGLTRGRTGLQSFFQPRTAREQMDDSGMPGIKRKTIHWGAPSPKIGSPDLENGNKQTRALNHNTYAHGMARAYNPNQNQKAGPHPEQYPLGEKVPLAELASPMGVDHKRTGDSDDGRPRRCEVSPLLKSTTPLSPSMSPVSPVSGRHKSVRTAAPSTTRSNTLSRTDGPNRESKALPQVKVNGQVIYELA